MKTLSVDVWSDIACPWCYVGKRRLEAALARFEHAHSVELTWRSFELDPAAPPAGEPAPYGERLAAKYQTSVERAEQMIRGMTETGAGDGLDFHFERIRPGNTFDAHRVLHLARVRGAGDVAKERFLRAYLEQGEAMSDHATLVRLATEVGLDPDEVRDALAGGDYGLDVRRDETEAQALGIRGVPFFVIGDRYGISGAQPADLLLGVLQRAWAELPDPVLFAEGAACGPEGC